MGVMDQFHAPAVLPLGIESAVLGSRLVGRQRCSGRGEEKKSPSPCRKSNPGRPSCN